jgi:hypothetical protein
VVEGDFFLHSQNDFIKNKVVFLRYLVDSVGTAIRGYDGYIYIPNLEEKLVKSNSLTQ